MNLYHFCHKDAEKSTIGAPWSRGDYTFATDGFLAIRVSRIHTIPENEKAPDVGRCFPSGDPLGWYPVPDVSQIEAPACPVCKGSHVNVDCRECCGSGTLDFSSAYNEYTVECKLCDGCGYLAECDYCHGLGKVLPEGVEIGHSIRFRLESLAKLSMIPGCEIGPVAIDRPALLRFDGGDGIVCTCR